MDASYIIDKLMVGLGFGDGYIAQGGDVGSFICRVLGATSESCKAVHCKSSHNDQLKNLYVSVNMSPARKPDDVSNESLPEDERSALGRSETFLTFGSAYAREHGTKPATIGLVLSSSPVALLAW